MKKFATIFFMLGSTLCATAYADKTTTPPATACLGASVVVKNGDISNGWGFAGESSVMTLQGVLAVAINGQQAAVTVAKLGGEISDGQTTYSLHGGATLKLVNQMPQSGGGNGSVQVNIDVSSLAGANDPHSCVTSPSETNVTLDQTLKQNGFSVSGPAITYGKTLVYTYTLQKQ